MSSALIIFTKNPVLGKVKTRLAKDIGEGPTLKLYHELISRTANVCLPIQKEIDLHVFYSDRIDEQDVWSDLACAKHIQSNDTDLGLRMKAAFRQLFNCGSTSVMIIGTDCPYLTTEVISQAANELEHNDLVIGPAVDGGFYLLGVHNLESLVFDEITWSSNNVYLNFMRNFSPMSSKIHILPELEDIDELAQYNRFKTMYKFLNSNKL